MSVTPILFLLIGGLLLAIGALGGLASERKRLQFIMREQAARNSEIRHRLGEMEGVLAQVQAENTTMSNFLVVLPDVVRQLNENKSRRSIPPLLLSTLQHIFEPSHALIFTTRGKDELALTHARGPIPDAFHGLRIPFGEGRIGLVAVNQVAMDRDSFQSDTLARRAGAAGTELPGVPIDLMAPLVNEGATLGVICVGGIGRRQRDEKRMIKLVADLGSLAMRNTAMMNDLETQANMDSLTGLWTKRFLNLRLGELTHEAERTHAPLSLVIFDIDHFKKVNDTWGHPAGDAILRAVAAIMKQCLRAEDIAARYGGEEFVAVLPGTVKEDATRIADKIRRVVEATPFPVAGEHPGTIRVTLSGGVATHLVDGKSSSQILGAADQALYLAKEQGRNRIVEYRSRYLSDDEAGMGATF